VKIDVFTLFPEWFEWFSSQRHVSNAIADGSSLECVNIRDHTTLSGGQVDDTPFGGGAGMVLRVDVLDSALRGHYGVDPVELRQRRRVIALAPPGRMLDDALVDELAAEPELTLLCGRYEGFDERILEHFASDAVSIGRYVLSGGELAAMVVCDAVMRKLPGALGHEESAAEESFSVALEGQPEYPHYTRPAEYRGWRVPDVLLSGHHERIREWRRERSRERGADAKLASPASGDSGGV
jgi:tRNA (guanine37-N1)-methyltransferase